MSKTVKPVWKIVKIVLFSVFGLALLLFLIIVCKAYFGFNDDYSTDDLDEYVSSPGLLDLEGLKLVSW